MEINGKEGGKRENSVGARGIIKGRERENGERENGKIPLLQKRGDISELFQWQGRAYRNGI